MSGTGVTETSRVIGAPPLAVYRAFLDPDALVRRLPAGETRGAAHAFEAREGGAFSMSLFYPDDETASRGKTTENSDRFAGRFVRLIPGERIVWAVTFDSSDSGFAGEMTITTMLQPTEGGTRITMLCADIPAGIRPEDNDAGISASLAKLAALLEG